MGVINWLFGFRCASCGKRVSKKQLSAPSLNVDSSSRECICQTCHDRRAEQQRRKEERQIKEALSASLIEAVLANDVAHMRALLESDVDVNLGDKDQARPLHEAAWKGNVEVADLLIARGAQIDARDKLQQTALHWVCGHPETTASTAMAELLLGKGASLDAKDQNLLTPLHQAAFEGHRALVALLVARGADVHAKSGRGRTPGSFAAEAGHTGIEAMLRAGGVEETASTTLTKPANAPSQDVDAGLDGKGPAAYLPGLMALLHLRVRIFKALLTNPAEFSRTAAVLQGDRQIPGADDRRVQEFLDADIFRGGKLPEGIKLRLLQQCCKDWPEDAMLAWEGIFNCFGPGSNPDAAACARQALSLNRECLLARQLVKLLTAKCDPRKPFGVPAESAPDVVKILSED